MSLPRLVCILGAECTGKTALAQALALHFGSIWVPEYLRSFCDLQQRTPKQHEQALVLQTQLEWQQQALQQASQKGLQHVFCDTAALQTAAYSDYYFSDKSLYPVARAAHAGYALTLLLTADLPWVADGRQRDGSQAQAAMHALLATELAGLVDPVRLAHISGSGPARLQAGIEAVAAMLGQPLAHNTGVDAAA